MHIEYHQYRKKWKAYGSLNINGYSVDIKTEKDSYTSVDDALAAIKYAAAKAVIDFNVSSIEE